MKEKIAEIIFSRIGSNIPQYQINEACDQILALLPSLEGIDHVEKCLNDEGVITPWISSTPEGCPLCKGTGTITRQAEWRDIDILYWLTMLTRLEAWITAWITDETRDVKGKSLLTTKSGGRLRVREKD